MPKRKPPKNTGWSLGSMHRCPECGKAFLIPDLGGWVYKKNKPGGANRTFWYCSWHCMRAVELRAEERRQARAAAAREAREMQYAAQKPQSTGGVPPVTEVKSRYTIHRCGACGKRVAMTSTHCKYCDTAIDWSVYEKKAEE